MAEGKNIIVIYRDWITTFDSLSDEEAGKLIKHLFRYVNDLNPEIPDRLTGLLFEPIKQTLKRDLKKYEAICLRNRENGMKGGRPPKNPENPVGYFGNPKNPDKPDKDIDKDKDMDKDIEKKREKKKYADFVFLADDEFNKLVAEHGEKNTIVFVNILNNYKGSTGKKYKSDYLTILNWVIDKAKKEGKYVTKLAMP